MFPAFLCSYYNFKLIGKIAGKLLDYENEILNQLFGLEDLQKPLNYFF